MQYPSSPHTSKPCPLAAAAGAEEDDWPAPPPWPDPVLAGTPPADLPLPPPPPHSGQRIEELPYVKVEAVTTPIIQPYGSLPQAQSSAYDAVTYARPWFRWGQPPGGSRMQPQPLPPTRTSHAP